MTASLKAALEVIKDRKLTPYTGPIERPQTLCQPGCLVCGGLGYIRQDLPVGHPEFGKMLLCPNVDIYRLPGMTDRTGLEVDELTSLAWSSLYDLNGVGEAVDAIKTVLREGWGWVFLWGGPGLAKTLLLKIAVAEWVRSNRNALASYTRMPEVLDHLKGAFDATSPSLESEQRLNYWSGLPLLCIDEFEKINPTPWATERSFLMFDRRYEAACREKSITLFASNKDPDTFVDYMADRIYDGRFFVVELKGDSLRPAMRRNPGRPSRQ